MNLYEMTYILRSDVDEDAMTAINERIGTRLKDAKGEMLKSEGWGRRRLAFPIDRVREGFYFTSILKVSGSEVRGFENQLKLMPEMLRFLLIQQDDANVNLEGSLLPVSHRPAPAVPPPEATGEAPPAETAADQTAAAEASEPAAEQAAEASEAVAEPEPAAAEEVSEPVGEEAGSAEEPAASAASEEDGSVSEEAASEEASAEETAEPETTDTTGTGDDAEPAATVEAEANETEEE